MYLDLPLKLESVLLLRLTQVPPQHVVDCLLQAVSLPRKERLVRMRYPMDQALSLYAECLVRCFACVVSGRKNQDLAWKTGRQDKPYFAGNDPFHFNIAHSKDVIALVCAMHPVGVDVEHQRKIHRRVAARFFCPEELEYIFDGAKAQDRFLETWTKKEAYIKWTGEGLQCPLDSFNTREVQTSGSWLYFTTPGYYISTFSEVQIAQQPVWLAQEEVQNALLRWMSEQ